MNYTKYLLPKGFKLLGFLFSIAGIGLGIVRFYFGVKPDVLSWKMFAFYSSYLESKYLLFVKNNMSEEITGLFLVLGLFMIAFSKEKTENEETNSLRLRAFFISAYAGLLFLVVSFLFTFGLAFVYMTMVNILVPFTAYIISFRIIVGLRKRRKHENPIQL